MFNVTEKMWNQRNFVAEASDANLGDQAWYWYVAGSSSHVPIHGFRLIRRKGFYPAPQQDKHFKFGCLM